MQDHLISGIGGYGYQYLETPLLENTELFLRQSGGGLASRLYSFVDAGSNPVSLRPEFTSPIMRYYLENAGQTALPARWQYAGPVFRYDLGHPESSGQFTQVGAELLGSGTVLADAELIALAVQTPEWAGVAGHWIELADLDVFHSLLDVAQISDRARNFILDAVPRLRQGPAALPAVKERAYQLHLGGRDPEYEELNTALAGLDDAQARQVIHGLLQWNSAHFRRYGQREPAQVVDRFMRKLRGSDEAIRLERALDLASQLAQVNGNPGSAVAEARVIVDAAGADTGPLNRLEVLLEVLEAAPSVAAALTVDFGLARGLAYYNGILFEIRHSGWDSPLGSGGRYDGLARALGSPVDVPALGFAYTLETLLALGEAGLPVEESNSAEAPVLVLATAPESCRYAFQVAQELTAAGVAVELEVCSRTGETAQEYARFRGIKQALLVGPNGERTACNVQ